jgi:hypothetical protein
MYSAEIAPSKFNQLIAPLIKHFIIVMSTLGVTNIINSFELKLPDKFFNSQV